MGGSGCRTIACDSEVPSFCRGSMKALDRRRSLGRSERSGASSLFPPSFTKAPTMENPSDLDVEDCAEFTAPGDMDKDYLTQELPSLKLGTPGRPVGFEGRLHDDIDMSNACQSARRMVSDEWSMSSTKKVKDPLFAASFSGMERTLSTAVRESQVARSIRVRGTVEALGAGDVAGGSQGSMFDLERGRSDRTTREQGPEDEDERRVCGEGEGACHTSSAVWNATDILAPPCQSCGWSTEFEETRDADGGLCSTCAGTRRSPSTPRMEPSTPCSRPGALSPEYGARISALVPSISPSTPRMEPSTPSSRPGALSPKSSSSQGAGLQLVPDRA